MPEPAPQLWRITFGQKYHREAHPVFGFVPTLPDQFVTVEAVTDLEARRKAKEWLGSAWAFIYPTVAPDDFLLRDEYVPLGEYVP